MNTKEVPSWEGFEEELRELAAERGLMRKAWAPLHVSGLLFRGQSSSTWRLETTLERSAPPHFLKVQDYYRAISIAKYQIESLTDRTWNILDPHEYSRWLDKQDAFGLGQLPGDDYMIHLRHHGFPSPLLDWSQSPYVAAFFAFRNASDAASHVSIYAYLEYAGHAKGGSTASPRICGRGPSVRSHRRHVLQQCEYTICTVQIEGQWHYTCHENAFAQPQGAQDLLWKFNIPSSVPSPK